MENRAGERRSLRELSGRLLALPAGAAPADRRDLPLRAHRRRHRRRRRRDARPSASPTCAAYRADLVAVAAGRAAVAALARGLRAARARRSPRIACPLTLLADLLDAFVQDVAADALRRPRRAARLLPPLGQSGRPPAAAPLRRRRRALRWRRSDAICSALQLANFWQDLGVDARARPPLRAARPTAAAPRRRRRTSCWRGRDSAGASRALVGELVAWARELMLRGAPLVARDRRAAPAGSCASSCRAACASSRRSTRSAARPCSTPPDARLARRAAARAGARCAMRAQPLRAAIAEDAARMTPEQYVQDKAAAERLELLLRLPVPAAAAARRDHRVLRLLPRGRRRRRRGQRPRRRRDQARLVAQRGRRSLRRQAAAIR